VVRPVTRGLDLAGDRIALAQTSPLDLVHGDVDVAGAGQVARGAHVGVVVADVEDAGDGHQLVAVAHLVVVVLATLRALTVVLTVALTTAAAAPPAPRAAAAAGAAATVVVVAVAA